MTATIELVAADFFAGELEAAACNSVGGEKVLTFTAANSGFLIARTQQETIGDFDTVLMLRTDCLSDVGEVCDDDGNTPGLDPNSTFDSFLRAPLLANTTYFLVVDSFVPAAPRTNDVVTLELVFE